MNDLSKQQVLALLAGAETKEALTLLRRLAHESGDSNIRQHVVQLSGRFQNLEKDKQKGIVSFENAELASNQIAADLTALTEAWSRGEAPPAPKPPSQADRTGTRWKIGAGIAAGLLVVFLAMKLLSGPLQLTVYVHGPEGKSDIVLENAGELIATFSNDRRTFKVGEKGRTNFGEIPAGLKGEEIQIGLNSREYEVAHPEKIQVLRGEPIYLEVRRKRSLLTISGVVKSRDGVHPIPGAEVNVNSDTTVTSNDLGKFHIVLPDRMYRPVYQLSIRKEGYAPEEEEYGQGVMTMEIRLTKLRN